MGRRFDPDRAHVNFAISGQPRESTHKVGVSFVILCHKRIGHLKQTLDALINCEGIQEAKIIFVAHDSPEALFGLINQYEFKEKVILRVDNINFDNPSHAINNNTFLGLKYAFEENASDFCCVVEDEIVLSPDALDFMLSSIAVFGKDRRFRGVMCYSMNSISTNRLGDVVKINFGIGWGWGINKKIYRKLLKFWTGTELNHWDYWIEPYIRTGFIVAPVYSRVMNIGFDSTATHTHIDKNTEIRIHQSFNSAKARSRSDICEVKFPYYHSRSDLSVISNLNYIQRQSLYLARQISFYFYLLAIKGHPRIHFLWRNMRNFIDKKFSNVSTN